MKACCLAGSSLRDIASGLRCSSPRRCTSAISPERLSETTSNSCSIHAPGRPRQGVADPGLQRCLLLQGQLAGATPLLEAGHTTGPVRLEKPVPRPDRIVVDQQHPTNILAAHPAIQQHQRVRPTGQTMLSHPARSQLGQVLPFLRCQKAAANHGAEKNPSVPVWQAVFSTSHPVAVYRTESFRSRQVMAKSESKKQQMAAGAALAAKRGDSPKSKLKGASRQMAESMSEKELHELASTKRKDLPTQESKK